MTTFIQITSATWLYVLVVALAITIRTGGKDYLTYHLETTFSNSTLDAVDSFRRLGAKSSHAAPVQSERAPCRAQGSASITPAVTRKCRDCSAPARFYTPPLNAAMLCSQTTAHSARSAHAKPVGTSPTTSAASKPATTAASFFAT